MFAWEWGKWVSYVYKYLMGKTTDIEYNQQKNPFAVLWHDSELQSKVMVSLGLSAPILNFTGSLNLNGP